MSGERVVDVDIAFLSSTVAQCLGRAAPVREKPPQIERFVHPRTREIPSGIGAILSFAIDRARGKSRVVAPAADVSCLVEEYRGARHRVVFVPAA